MENNLATLAGVALAWGALAIAGRRRGQPRRTPGQMLVRVLGRHARFWQSVYVAADKAVLHFHLHKQQTPIEPESGFARGA
jgi:hypothetical protein